MDSRKFQFLEAVVGTDGARALSKAAERAEELDQAIFPRVVVSWLESMAPFGFEGEIPGVDSQFRFTKSENGFNGMVTVNGEIHSFEDASINHLAGCVAVALGLDHERASTQVKPQQMVKLGKSIDLLVKTQLVKTSWNVKMRRKYQFDPATDKPWETGLGPGSGAEFVKLTPGQRERRRAKYAHSIGLDPKYDPPAGGDFPQSSGGNSLPYGGQFDVEHETAHAMMTPPGQTIQEYQQNLTPSSQVGVAIAQLHSPNPEKRNAALLDPRYIAHNIGTQQENIANHLEYHIDRRAGVDPNEYKSQYRSSGRPLGSSVTGVNVIDPIINERAGLEVPTESTRQEAQHYVQRFDEGAKIDKQGRVQPPSGIDAKINARAKKLPMTKAAIQPNNKKRINLPGVAAAPIAPKLPMAPTPIQPKNQKQAPAGAAGSAQSPQLPQVSKPKKPTVAVTKNESQKKCPHCARSQFNGDKFNGCYCFNALSKSVKTQKTATGYTLEFGAAWDQEAILSLVETFKGK